MSTSSGLQALAARLDRVASGEAAERAATKAAGDIEAQARAALAGHRRTGLAESDLAVVANGPSLTLSQESYLKFHSWWPFREGFSPDVASAAAADLKAETLSLIRG